MVITVREIIREHSISTDNINVSLNVFIKYFFDMLAQCTQIQEKNNVHFAGGNATTSSVNVFKS